MSMPQPAPASAIMTGQIRTSLDGPTIGGIEFHRLSLIDRTDQISQVLDALEHMLGDARSRLEPVLRPSMPSPPSDPQGIKVPPPDRTPDGSWLADWFDTTRRRIENVCTSVGAMTDRIDL